MISEWKTFINQLGNDLCIDLKNYDTSNGAEVQLWTCNDSPNQKWYMDPLGRIRSKININKCIEAPGAELLVWDCNYGLHQQWSLESDGRIRNKKTGYNIGVPGGCNGVSSDKRLEMHQKFEGGNCGTQQSWFHEVWAPFVTFRNDLDENLCIDLKGADTSNGAEVLLWTCHDSPNQKWYMDLLGRIRSKININKCIEAPGAELLVWDCNDGLHQQWSLTSDGRIRNKKTGYNIGVSRGCHGVSSDKRLETHKWMSSYGYGGRCQTQQKWVSAPESYCKASAAVCGAGKRWLVT